MDVTKLLRECSGLENDPSMASAAVEETLFRPQLDDAERTELMLLGDPSLEAQVDRVLEMRMEQAVERLASEDSSSMQATATRVEVKIASEAAGTHSVPDLASALVTTRQCAEGDSRSILLTDDEGFEAVTRVLPRTSEVGFVSALDLDSDSLAATRALAGATPVTVIQAGSELASCREKLRSRLATELMGLPRGLSSEDLAGTVLSGKYRMDAVIGKGGFGTVYAATDVILDARVAVKVLNPKAASAQNALEDFLAEAKLLTTLDHENIVRWITFDQTADGLHYFVMEYLRGEELKEILDRDGPLEPKRAARMLLQVLSALRRAHRLPGGGSLLHLDLKPANVFVVERTSDQEPEKVKVIDFGIGQHVGAQALLEEGDATDVGSGLELIGDGDLQHSMAVRPLSGSSPTSGRGVKRARGGTLVFASPEQCRHLAGLPDIEELDGRSDLYSLGVMAFRMLTGVFPFEQSKTARQAILNHLEVAPRKIRSVNRSVPRPLAAFVDRCLEKNPDQRWKNTDEACAALERIVNPSRWRAAVAVALPLILALAFAISLREPTIGDAPIFTMRDGQRVSLEGETLYLEPGQTSPVLQIEPRQGKALAGKTIEVIDRSTKAVENRLLATWEDDRSLTFRVAPDARYFERRVLVRYDSTSGTQETKAFHVVCLPSGCWEIGEPMLGDRPLSTIRGSDRVIDPRGMELVIPLSTPDGFTEDHVARAMLGPVSLRAGTTEDSLVYRVRLDDPGVTARVQAGEELVFIDRTGQTHRRAVQLDVVPPLRVRSHTLADCGRAAGRYLLVPESQPQLQIEASHNAYRVRWELVAMPDLWGGQPPAGEYLSKETPILPITGAREGYEGVLRVTLVEDAARVVTSRPTPEELTFDVAVEFSPEKPNFAASLVVSGQTEVELSTTEPAALGDRTPSLLLRRGIDQRLRVRARVEIRSELAGNARIGEIVERDFSAGVTRQSIPLDLENQADGDYVIEVQGFRLDSRGQVVGEEAEYVVQHRVRLDTEGPIFDGADADLGAVIRTARFTPTITFREASLPARIEWSLERQNRLRSGVAPDPQYVLDFGELTDGTHRVRVVATDRAGNESAPLEREFEVAAQDPRVDWLYPTRGQVEWSPKSGRWEILTRVVDGNEIGRVSYRVTNPEGHVLHEGPLTRVEEDGNEWKATLPGFSPRDSRANVVISVIADDVHFDPGLEARGDGRTQTQVAIQLPNLALPSRITSGIDGTEMVLVPGNRESSYTFGGRTSERAGRGWSIEYGRGDITDFYLDAHEVTNAAFIRYLKARHPDDPRIETLAQLPAEVPVIDVTWDDAHGYARWAGKQLPTFVQWEYAVRGRDYRDPEGSPGSRVHYGRERNPTVLWSGDQGADEIAGIRNLCGNVSEWTSTPWRRDFVRHARENPGLVLQPWNDDDSDPADRYYLVGACQTSTSCTVFKVSAPSRTQLRPNDVVGFRCAVSADEVRNQLAGSLWNPQEEM